VKTPVLVVGAEDDTVIPLNSIHKTARAYHTEPIIIPDLAHDAMLDTRWQVAADHILSWLHEKGL
jgi:alpha-beta hydrolase superfamily lysophospholipase